MKNKTIKLRFEQIIISIIFLCFIAFNNKLSAQNRKIELDEFAITQNSNLDSVNFSIDGRILPKAMHVKASITIQPVLIFNSDSIKFPNLTLVGEKKSEGFIIAYKSGGRFKFSKTVKIPSDVKKGVAKIVVVGNNEISSSLCTTFEKEFDIK